ncbi:MAG: TerB N-terminal domain-containing protein, partial [Lachnospiraceae bacterium]|nr:TerB N-terminal domain-containing protein [Lachnospiraceae bacterium]
MRLAELADYAKNKYGIREDHKWADFPGFSVLTDPYTGKWAALMMQRWDQETGEITECCDIKCGRQTLSEYRLPYLTESFRMRGQKWIGVRFEDNTDRHLIYALFDRAVRSGEQRGYTISLGSGPGKQNHLFGSVPIRRGTGMRPAQDPDMPDRIRDMIRLYEYGDGSFHQKCKNFYLQGMFMKDYEDDYPWTGQFGMYFPTYHDLNYKQLRGYFSWRKDIRNGIFRAIPTSAAYIYIFELINGIGVSSAEESVRKLSEFEAGFIDAGIGNPDMKKNIRRW